MSNARRKVLAGVVTLVFLASAVGLAATALAKAEKVEICHFTPTLDSNGKGRPKVPPKDGEVDGRPFLILSVPMPAVAAHLGHGDLLFVDGQCGDGTGS